MNKTMTKLIAITGILLTSTSVMAEGWCYFEPGDYEIITHGNKSNQVYITGKFTGSTVSKWVNIANDTVGKYNVSLVLAAQMAGKGVNVYIDSSDYNCETYPSWSTSPIRHVRITM